MDAKKKQGFVIGLAAGIALFAFFYASTHAPICFILIPLGAVMGIAPQCLKPIEKDDD